MKVFIINLERSKDRKEYMQKQISILFEKNPALKEKLEFIFFKAVDAKNKEHLEFQRHFPCWASWVFGRELSDGEKAVYASHFKLWQECIRFNEAIMILEDDVEFSEEFIINGRRCIKKLEVSNYEYIRLRYTFKRNIKPLSGNFFISFESVAGAQGYFIKPSAALKFINHSKKWFKPVDDSMDMCYYNKVLNIIYQPFLLSDREVMKTTIYQRKNKPVFYKKITREIFRLYFNLYKLMFSFWIRKKLNIK